MIKNNEVRVGNWVKEGDWSSDSIFVQLDSIEPIIGEYEWDENLFNPIPLTPEILEKCGFETIGKPPFYSMRLPVNGLDELCWYSQDGFIRYLGIKHLHQLQNLYFALTGNELEVKL